MRISDWSSDVCSSDLADQEQMDKAELLREFVFNAVPKGEGLLRDPSGGQVRVQVRLLGFDGPPEFEEFGAGDSARSEERRVGQECVSTCRSRWSQYH